MYIHELLNHGLLSSTLIKSSRGSEDDSERVTPFVAWEAGIKHLKFGIIFKA